MNDDQPIATYRERLLQVRRDFMLFPDRIIVEARWLNGRRYRNTIPLHSLNPKPQQTMRRQRIFRRTLTIALLSAATAVVISRPGYEILHPWLAYILYALFVFFGIVTLRAWPKVLFIQFASRQEEKPGLDIARAGPDKRNFDTFIEQIRKQIRKA